MIDPETVLFRPRHVLVVGRRRLARLEARQQHCRSPTNAQGGFVIPGVYAFYESQGLAIREAPGERPAGAGRFACCVCDRKVRRKIAEGRCGGHGRQSGKLHAVIPNEVVIVSGRAVSWPTGLF